MSQNTICPVVDILKILTPNVIMAMTKSVKRSNRISLTKVIYHETGLQVFEGDEFFTDSGNSPKKEIEKKLPAVGEDQLAANANSLAKETEKENGEIKINPEEKEKERPLKLIKGEALPEGTSLSIFLLQQKEKLRDAQKKLKKKEILNLYSDSNLMERDAKKSESEEESSAGSAQYGTLLNKKQS